MDWQCEMRYLGKASFEFSIISLSTHPRIYPSTHPPICSSIHPLFMCQALFWTVGLHQWPTETKIPCPLRAYIPEGERQVINNRHNNQIKYITLETNSVENMVGKARVSGDGAGTIFHGSIRSLPWRGNVWTEAWRGKRMQVPELQAEGRASAEALTWEQVRGARTGQGAQSGWVEGTREANKRWGQSSQVIPDCVAQSQDTWLLF